MNGDGKPPYVLASPDEASPTSSSYWVVRDLLLAGAYPGASDPEKHHAKVQALLDAGIRMFVNLMEETETNTFGQPFVPYDGLVGQLCPEAVCRRYPIQDLSVPSADEMVVILDVIDESLAAGKSVYVHCWGGVGRTGTVIGCWLLRHGLAEPRDFIGVLDGLRQQDRERGRRVSPETAGQQRFVRQWASRESR